LPGKSSEIVRKVNNIVSGNLNLLIGKKYEFTDDRIRTCQKCEFGTWLKHVAHVAYFKWLIEHGIDVAANITDLTVLPDLPKQEYQLGCELFCMKCKCKIPAKARVPEEKCPQNKW